MSLYVAGKKYNLTVARWRGFWSVTIYGFPGTIIDCGFQKVIGDDGKVTFKFAESDTYTFIAMKDDKTQVFEVELVEGEYFIEKDMYLGTQLLEYIENSGEQKIIFNNSDFTFDDIIEVGFGYNASSTGSGRYIWGQYDDEIQAYGGGARLLDDSSGIRAGWASNNWLNMKCSISTLSKNTMVSTIDGVTVNDVYIGTPFKGSVKGGKYSLFCWSNNPLRAGIRIYYFKVMRNGQYVINAVPVRNNGEVLGMYDMVSGQLFSNVGTGEFIPGPVKR